MTHTFLPAADGATYDLYGKKVPILGYDVVGGVAKPRLGLKMMSDEEWQRSAIRQAHERFVKAFGRAAADDREALAYTRRLIEELHTPA